MGDDNIHAWKWFAISRHREGCRESIATVCIRARLDNNPHRPEMLQQSSCTISVSFNFPTDIYTGLEKGFSNERPYLHTQQLFV